MKSFLKRVRNLLRLKNSFGLNYYNFSLATKGVTNFLLKAKSKLKKPRKKPKEFPADLDKLKNFQLFRFPPEEIPHTKTNLTNENIEMSEENKD